MKSGMIVSTLITAALIMPLAMAEAPAKADKKPAATAGSEADMDKYYAAMQDRYKKMQEQMERLRKAKDPAERQKLWEEHWQTMHEGMDMMMGRGGMGPGMMMGGMGMMRGMGPGGPAGGMGPGGGMGSGMGPRGGMGPACGALGAQATPEQMAVCQRRIEQRMDMMQMMMDQMLERQRLGQPPASK